MAGWSAAPERSKVEMTTRPATRAHPIGRSLREYARGLAGGLMFSIPLLFTMEMWWAGFITQPEQLLAYLAVTFALLLGYNRYAGIHQDASWVEVVIDSVEEIGLGLVTSALVLFLLGQITFQTGLEEIIGKIVMNAMTVAIGVSVGTAQLGSGDEEEKTGMTQASDARHFPGQIVIALCGAVLFAANVAPTDEIFIIAHSITPWHMLGLAAFSITVSAVILYYSEFHGSKRFRKPQRNVVAGTVETYVIALIASAVILWFFGRFDGEPLLTALGQIVVLAVAGSLGASAGRLLLQ